MPGAGFLKEAEEMRVQLLEAANNPYDWCKHNLVGPITALILVWSRPSYRHLHQSTGIPLMPNFCGTIIQSLEADNQLSKGDESNIVWAAGSMLGGGLDTVR